VWANVESELWNLVLAWATEQSEDCEAWRRWRPESGLIAEESQHTCLSRNNIWSLTVDWTGHWQQLVLWDILSLQVTINLAVINRFFADPKGALFVFGFVAFSPFSCKFHHCITLDILDVETPFWEPALKLLLTVRNLEMGLEWKPKGNPYLAVKPKSWLRTWITSLRGRFSVT
jgi:hypothetical protein